MFDVYQTLCTRLSTYNFWQAVIALFRIPINYSTFKEKKLIQLYYLRMCELTVKMTEPAWKRVIRKIGILRCKCANFLINLVDAMKQRGHLSKRLLKQNKDRMKKRTMDEKIFYFQTTHDTSLKLE